MLMIFYYGFWLFVIGVWDRIVTIFITSKIVLNLIIYPMKPNVKYLYKIMDVE
jgi:hypothetical protein